MVANAYQFGVSPSVPFLDAEMSLHLAMQAVAGLFGEARVRLEASYHADEGQRAITVDGGTEVGAALVKVYTQLLTREFGEDAFTVRASAQRPNADLNTISAALVR